MLPPDIENYVRSNFALAEQEAALKLLAAAKSHDGSFAGSRLLRCALVASDGTLKWLQYQLDGVAHDYRDVILQAEYVRKKGQWVQIRDLSLPLANHA